MSEQRMTNEKVWCLTEQNINDLQADSIDRLIERCGAAHYVNVHIRINGRDEIVEADWLKHMKRVVDPTDQGQLLSFYSVHTKDELIDRLHRHIERLQAKLPSSEPPGGERTHVREG
jgi:uncharacterized small protein (DUF1192 family)